ncbi:hypothetical protein NEILACOT_05667 [Neisseria lactamica ATCC 23970]|uniref:Uncharacterized protein n=1 Tax=Neisseria lactamica ATCC 23970 TaxID=546265 RepID=D0WDM9_NEILA|nr:hypothetical protein NEILACOT_05667 [Neisseria lactamica ATCC 23970]
MQTHIAFRLHGLAQLLFALALLNILLHTDFGRVGGGQQSSRSDDTCQ